MQPKDKNSGELVVLLNEPRLTGHEIDKEFDERRKQFAYEMQAFIATHKLFRSNRIEVTFAQSGISSLVSIIDTGEKKYVLKIPLKLGRSENEAIFLKAWEDVGVRVPHVIEVEEMNGNPYLLMEYIDARQLREAYTVEELIERGLYAEMAEF